MTTNDILRNLRYTFDFSDSKMISIFASTNHEISRTEVSQWLKKDDDPNFVDLKDVELATFLDGLINDRRGKKEGPQPEPTRKLTNNMIFRKINIALNLKSDDIIEIMALADFKISKHELSAFFRKPTHSNYRPCKNQVLRNFLKGLQFKYHPSSES